MTDNKDHNFSYVHAVNRKYTNSKYNHFEVAGAMRSHAINRYPIVVSFFVSKYVRISPSVPAAIVKMCINIS